MSQAEVDALAAANAVTKSMLDGDMRDPAPPADPTVAGTAKITVTSALLANQTDGNTGASVGLATVNPDGTMVQSIVIVNAGGLLATTASLVDNGGGTTVAQLAAKIRAAIGAGELALDVTTALATTTTPNDAVLITANALGQSVRVTTESDGLAVVETPGS